MHCKALIIGSVLIPISILAFFVLNDILTPVRQIAYANVYESPVDERLHTILDGLQFFSAGVGVGGLALIVYGIMKEPTLVKT
ncbi:MAG: hypothetical protein MN733_43085 [Nitrososphaera sp.]|nr:hypothetical protein [Nitrososphaera sp.]